MICDHLISSDLSETKIRFPGNNKKLLYFCIVPVIAPGYSGNCCGYGKLPYSVCFEKFRETTPAVAVINKLIRETVRRQITEICGIQAFTDSRQVIKRETVPAGMKFS